MELLSPHPLCGGGDLLFWPIPSAAVASCFCSQTETLVGLFLNIFSMQICPGEFAC